MSTIIEKCSCGATITAEGSSYRSDRNPNNPRGVEEIVERWRTDHKHEIPAPVQNVFRPVGTSAPIRPMRRKR